jgi:CBS domain-containing protein
MQVNEAMSGDVKLINPNQTIRDAARMMAEIDAGVLPVSENDRLVGMITDRDIAIRAVAEGRDPTTPVREVMTERVQYCFEDESVSDVARNMADLGVRRLPVVSRDKRLVGIVALSNIAQAGDNRSKNVLLEGVAAPH